MCWGRARAWCAPTGAPHRKRPLPILLPGSLAPLPPVAAALDPPQTDAVVSRIPVGRGPDADGVADAQRLLLDAVALQAGAAGPFRGVGPPPAERVRTVDVHPGMRVLILEFDDLPLDFDGVLLEIHGRERVMREQGSRREGQNQRHEAAHVTSPLSPARRGRPWSSADPGSAGALSRDDRNRASADRGWPQASQSTG